MAEIILLSLPIGNLGDITYRVKNALMGNGIFVVEDTRSFKHLLAAIDAPLEGKHIWAYHDQSSQASLDKIIEKAEQHDCIYFCSEAGSPVISDPAYGLLKEAKARAMKISSFPGPSSLVMALELCAFPVNPFMFHGFLPRGEQSLKNFFAKIISHPNTTHVFFESPQRIRSTIRLSLAVMPEAKFCLCREMTKMYESTYHFGTQDGVEIIDQLPEQGEYVCVCHIGEVSNKEKYTPALIELANEVIKTGGQKKVTAKLLSEILDIPSKEIYKHLSSSDR